MFLLHNVTVRTEGGQKYVLWCYTARSRYVVTGLSVQPQIDADGGRCIEQLPFETRLGDAEDLVLTIQSSPIPVHP
jgi:hypothetical protein